MSPRTIQRGDPEFVSRRRDEAIDRLWTFLRSIKIGGNVDELVAIGANGQLAPTRTPAGDFNFTGEIDFSGASVNIAADDIQINSQGPLLLRAASANGFSLYATDTDGVVILRIIGIAGGIERYLKIDPNAIADTAERTLAAQNLSGALPVIGNDAPAVASGSLGKVDLTAQVANIASTALSNTPPAGLYEVEAYLVTTTNDVTAGTLALTVGYTDTGGARTATLIAAHSLTALGPSTGRQIVQLASGDITYAVTVTGIFGTSAYAVYLRVVALG